MGNATKLKLLNSLLRLAVILLLAFVVNSIVLLIVGKDPIFVYQKLLEGSLIGKWSIAKTLRWSISLLLCGMAAAVAFTGGVFNLGIDGQLYMGSMAATVVGIYCEGLPGYLLIPTCIAASVLAGSCWSAIAGILNVRFGANIVVLTLMMNYIATLFTRWCIMYPLYTEAGAAQRASEYIAEEARLSVLFPGTQVTSALFVAIIMLIIVYFWIEKTSSGFEVKVLGSNPQLAGTVGINIDRKKMQIILISGAFAGLCGGLEILGLHHRFATDFVTGIGFDGMVVAMLSNNNPLLMPIGALFMGAMKSGASSLEMFADVPRSMATVLVGIIIMFVTVKGIKNPFARFLGNRKKHTSQMER